MKQLRTNKDIRDKIDEYELYHYEVANILNIKPSNFSVLLKMELTDLQREKIFAAIEKAYQKREEKDG